jgi:hypothetical protein
MRTWRRWMGSSFRGLGLAGGLASGALACISLSACSEQQPAEPLGRTSLALTSYTITMPKGASLGQFALVANGTLDVGDRVKVVDSANFAANVANAGTQLSTLGVDSSLGAVRSVGGISVRDRARVGELTSAGSIQLGNDVTVSGGQFPNNSGLTPAETQSIAIEFGGTGLGDVTLNSPNTGERVTDLAPGRYARVTIQPRNRVNLRSGSYVLNDLTLEAQARFVIDDSAGPVFISVRDTLLYKGLIQSQSGKHPALRFAYVGTQAATLETAFSGTFLAPNATIRLATVGFPARFTGSFFAKSLTVSPDSVVEYRPYLVYQATRDFEVSNAGFGTIGYAAVAPDRSINARVPSNVLKITPAGVATPLLPTPIQVQYLVDPDTGAFGYYGDRTFHRYRPDGSLLASYPMPRMAQAHFVPGTEKTAILLSNDDHEPEWIGLRVVGPGVSFDRSVSRLQAFAATSTRLVYTTLTAFTALDHAGAQLFSLPLALRQFAVSSAGARLIGVRDERGSAKVVHVDLAAGTLTNGPSLPSPAYALGVAPGGRYSFAATRTRLYVFDGNTLARELTLPFTDFASADVNDQGEVIAGGATASNTVLFLSGSFGTQSFTSSSGASDNVALRPYVRFEKGRADFLAVRKEGLSRYTVTRSF